MTGCEPNKSILLTGGAGYIGSHSCVELIPADFDLTIFDSLCKSRGDVVDRLERICGVRPAFSEDNARDPAARWQSTNPRGYADAMAEDPHG